MPLTSLLNKAKKALLKREFVFPLEHKHNHTVTFSLDSKIYQCKALMAEQGYFRINHSKFYCLEKINGTNFWIVRSSSGHRSRVTGVKIEFQSDEI